MVVVGMLFGLNIRTPFATTKYRVDDAKEAVRKLDKTELDGHDIRITYVV